MPDIVLKDRSGVSTTYSGVTAVGLDDTDGNEQVFYSEEALTNYYKKDETYSKEEVYDKAQVDSKVEAAIKKAAENCAETIDKRVVGSIDEDGNFVIMFDETFWSIE